MSCILCERQSTTAFYSFQTTTTMHTITPVKIYCEKLIGTTFEVENDEDEVICECCFKSVNELDHMEKRMKQITDDLRRRYKKKQKGEISLTDEEHTKEDLIANELDDCGSRHSISNSPEPLEQNHPKVTVKNKIHFSNENELKNILDVKLNNKQEPNETRDLRIKDEFEHDVSVLYNMMDDKYVEIIVESKKDDPPKKTFQCSKCSNTFETNHELKSHIVSHTEERPYICEICGKVYRHKAALDIHVGMHNGINPYKCLYCNKSFTQKGALIRHVKIHTGKL